MTWNLTRRNFLSLSLAVGSAHGWGAGHPGWSKASYRNNLGIITDELTQDFEGVLNFISSYSLSYCEVRDLWQKNVLRLSHEELERARQLIEKHGLKVSEIGSPIFKYHLPGMHSRRADLSDTFLAADLTDQDSESLLRHVFKVARFFGTSKVRIFSYWRMDEPEAVYRRVRDRLMWAAALAAQNKITLLLENEHDCNVGTGRELGRMLRDINSPYLRGMWDPCNAVRLGEVPYPEGYGHVRGLFQHMHIKDIRKDTATGTFHYVPVGEGIIDYKSQLAALHGDGYDGTMSLETAYLRPDGNKVESTRECLEGLFRVMESVSA